MYCLAHDLGLVSRVSQGSQLQLLESSTEQAKDERSVGGMGRGCSEEEIREEEEFRDLGGRQKTSFYAGSSVYHSFRLLARPEMSVKIQWLNAWG